MDAAKENVENGSINKMTVDTIFDEKKTIGQRIKEQFKENLLLLLLLISLGIGVGMGAGLRSLDPPFDKRQLMYFRFPGDLLMRMLKMLILPLIVSSLISGLASLDAKTSGKMGLRAIVYYLATTFIAVVIGIILVMTIRPGKQTGTVVEEGQRPAPANTADSFLDLIRYREFETLTNNEAPTVSILLNTWLLQKYSSSQNFIGPDTDMTNHAMQDYSYTDQVVNSLNNG